MRTRAWRIAMGTGAAAIAGCGGGDALPPVVPIGAAGPHRPGSLVAAIAHGRPVGRLACRADRPPGELAHVELFGGGLGVVVPAGIGVAPPRSRVGAYVRGGRCTYPLATREPTGVVELAAGTRPTLGDLFALLGQPLGRRRMGGFRAPVRAWLDGREWHGPLTRLPLRRHAQVVVAAGPQEVPVHASYAFAR